MPDTDAGGRTLLVLSNTYPPHSLGGYELLCADHVAWLVGRGHRVTVVTSTWGCASRRRADESGVAGERVIRALDFHWEDYAHRRPTGLGLVTAELRQRRLLERVLREQVFDAVAVWHMAALSKSLLAVVARAGLRGVAVIGEPWPEWDIPADTWTGRWTRVPRRPWSRLVKPPLRRLASRLIAPVSLDAALDALTPVYASDWLRRTVEAAVPRWRGRGEVVPNGIRLDRGWRERPEDEALGSPLRLLYAGRVERRKGVETAVRVLAALSHRGVAARLTVAGWQDRVFVSELQTLAKSEAVEALVTLTAAVPREGIPDTYQGHDVLLFPSQWEEPFGLAPLEAMATGCLVVATATGGSAEYLRDGQNALLFPAGDARAAAACVERLRGDAPLVARLRAGGRATAARHGFEDYAAHLERMIVAASAGPQPASSW